MELEIPYGKVTVRLRLPDDAEILHPNPVRTADEREMLLEALRHPVGKPPFDRFVSGEEEILIVVNDATRPTPTPRVLDALSPWLAGKRVRFIVATGSHRKPTSEEYGYIFGNHYEKNKDDIHAHDAKGDPMVYLGKTRRGTEVRLSKTFLDARKIIIINSTEPHYFAGFTGGRKSILPGVSSFSTIEQNHRNALKPSARLCALEGNPVSEDMEEVASFVKNDIFSVMVVLDSANGIYKAVCGDLDASFKESVGYSREVSMVKIRGRADIVITVARPPMNIDFYQSQKALENGRLALKEGGILILVSECRGGVGPRDFFDLLASGSTPQEALARIEEGYVLGYHKAAKIAELLNMAQVWAKTEVPQEEMKRMFITSYDSLQRAVDDALAQKGKEASVIVLTDGGMTVPSPP